MAAMPSWTSSDLVSRRFENGTGGSTHDGRVVNDQIRTHRCCMIASAVVSIGVRPSLDPASSTARAFHRPRTIPRLRSEYGRPGLEPRRTLESVRSHSRHDDAKAPSPEAFSGWMKDYVDRRPIRLVEGTDVGIRP